MGDFMTDEMYERLNKYLNDIFLELNKKSKIFIDELTSIVYLSIKISNLFNTKIINKSKENNISFNDVYLLGREIVEYINPKYLKEYDDLISSGKLEFDYDNKDISFSRYIYENDIKIINITRKFNYSDVITLIHEFFHYTEFRKKMTYNHEFLTEFISIYFEKIAERYLIQEKNVPVDEISCNYRIIDFLNSNNRFYEYSIILLAYEKLGNINKNTENELKNILNIKDEFLEQECIKFLKKLDKINELNSKDDIARKMAELVNSLYKYIIGTFLAYYALDNSKLEDMIKLNDNINSYEYCDLTIEELLETINIRLNSQMIDETLNIIKNSIYDYGDKIK